MTAPSRSRLGIGIAIVAMVLVMGIGASSAQQDPVIGTSENQKTILITSIIGFLSLLATQLFSFWREYRNRAWDLQDRATAREEQRKNAEQLRLETIQAAIEIARQNAMHRQHIVEEINRNTELTQEVGAKADAAYTAANNFTARMEALRKELQSKGNQIDHIENVSEDTNEKVTDLKEGK